MKNQKRITFTMKEVPTGWQRIWGAVAWVPVNDTRHGTQSQLDAAKLLKVKYPLDVVGSFSLIK